MLGLWENPEERYIGHKPGTFFGCGVIVLTSPPLCHHSGTSLKWTLELQFFCASATAWFSNPKDRSTSRIYAILWLHHWACWGQREYLLCGRICSISCWDDIKCLSAAEEFYYIFEEILPQCPQCWWWGTVRRRMTMSTTAMKPQQLS